MFIGHCFLDSSTNNCMEKPITLLQTLLYARASLSMLKGTTSVHKRSIYDHVFSAGDENSRAADVCGNRKASSSEYSFLYKTENSD